MLRTNKDQLVMISVQGRIAPPEHLDMYRVSSEGKPYLAVRTGGICYNVKIGDSVFGWAADHVEPGVSTLVDPEKRDGRINKGYHYYSCVGNQVRVVSGDAKGKIGIVTGHHGGAEHVLVDFDDDTLDQLTLSDLFLIKGYGQGLKFPDYPDIHPFNLDPALFEKMNVKDEEGVLHVGVRRTLPSYLMGSGIGSRTTVTGDYDIMSSDRSEIKRHQLDDLCFGDLVAILDHDNVYGRSYRKGAVSIGVVIHSDCPEAGHGPGVTTLLTSPSGQLQPVIDEDANIGKMLKIGRYRD